ncbi:hypothetical protein J4214_03190 [Candidatus Woesearchaeota archaeon]|nr:hypothetical protein [Candidatus Woesearchaeota archaeon]
MEDIPELELLGLTKNERVVYLTLLQLGPSGANELSRQCQLHRSYLYDVLNKLQSSGLLSVIVENGKKVYSCVSPKKILEIMQIKVIQAEREKKQIQSIIPRLSQTEEKQEDPIVRVYHGKKGIQVILEDILEKKKDFIALGTGRFSELFKWYYTNWHYRRIKKNIKYRIIYDESLKKTRPTKEQKLVSIKFVSSGMGFPATTIVYGNIVSIIIWDDNPIAFQLLSKKVAISYKEYFEFLWKIAK